MTRTDRTHAELTKAPGAHHHKAQAATPPAPAVCQLRGHPGSLQVPFGRRRPHLRARVSISVSRPELAAAAADFRMVRGTRLHGFWAARVWLLRHAVPGRYQSGGNRGLPADGGGEWARGSGGNIFIR